MTRGHRIEILDVFESGGVRVRYLDHPLEVRTWKDSGKTETVPDPITKAGDVKNIWDGFVGYIPSSRFSRRVAILSHELGEYLKSFFVSEEPKTQETI